MALAGFAAAICVCVAICSALVSMLRSQRDARGQPIPADDSSEDEENDYELDRGKSQRRRHRAFDRGGRRRKKGHRSCRRSDEVEEGMDHAQECERGLVGTDVIDENEHSGEGLATDRCADESLLPQLAIAMVDSQAAATDASATQEPVPDQVPDLEPVLNHVADLLSIDEAKIVQPSEVVGEEQGEELAADGPSINHIPEDLDDLAHLLDAKPPNPFHQRADAMIKEELLMAQRDKDMPPGADKLDLLADSLDRQRQQACSSSGDEVKVEPLRLGRAPLIMDGQAVFAASSIENVVKGSRLDMD